MTCAADVVDCHVVEQDHVHAGRNRRFKLREVFAFDLDFQPGTTNCQARVPTRYPWSMELSMRPISALKFPTIKALQTAIKQFCAGHAIAML